MIKVSKQEIVRALKIAYEITNRVDKITAFLHPISNEDKIWMRTVNITVSTQLKLLSLIYTDGLSIFKHDIPLIIEVSEPNINISKTLHIPKLAQSVESYTLFSSNSPYIEIELGIDNITFTNHNISELQNLDFSEYSDKHTRLWKGLQEITSEYGESIENKNGFLWGFEALRSNLIVAEMSQQKFFWFFAPKGLTNMYPAKLISEDGNLQGFVMPSEPKTKGEPLKNSTADSLDTSEFDDI